MDSSVAKEFDGRLKLSFIGETMLLFGRSSMIDYIVRIMFARMH